MHNCTNMDRDASWIIDGYELGNFMNVDANNKFLI